MTTSIKILRLEDNIIICVLFVIQTFRTSLQALYNHNFANFSPKYNAKLTQIKLLTLQYNKVHDFITTIWLVLGWGNSLKALYNQICAKY